jgi:two-component system, cell cycle sensor histidine kinase and response regulator CckA
MESQTAHTIEGTERWCGSTGEDLLVGSEAILFAEDEVFVREVTSEVLRAAGYRLLTARDADEAVRTYEERCGGVDLLLTDVVLPGTSGRALAQRLRRNNEGLKVLFVTGYAEQMGLNRAGQEECLAKPFCTEVLLRRVRRLLDHKSSESERTN